MSQQPRLVTVTYRVGLVHLESDGRPVCGDDGEPITENVEVSLSWPTTLTRAQRPCAAQVWKLAARRAATKANAGMATQRSFDTTGVEVIGKRSRPLSRRA